MTEEQFLAILPAHILEGCRNSTQLGFSEYAKSYHHRADKHSARTVANLIHDEIVENVKEEVCDKHFRFYPYAHRNIFCYKDELIIIFKKFDEALQSSNYPTESAMKFSLQEPLQGIPPVLPRIEIGYVTDAAGATITGIFAVKRNGKKIDWSIDLNQNDGPRQRDFKIA